MKELMMVLDKMEEKTKYDVNVAAFWSKCDEISGYLKDCNPLDKKAEYEASYNILRKEWLASIAKQDAVWIEHIVKKLSQLYFRCKFSDPRILASYMQYLIEKAQAKQSLHPSLPVLISRAQDALVRSDVKEMQEIFWIIHPFVLEEKIEEVSL